MELPYLDLKKQYAALQPELTEAVQQVLQGGQYILGPQVEECEAQLAQFSEAPHCVTVASGTDALLLSLLACGIQPGDEVIVPSFSFFATGEVVALLGARPVFVDIDEDSFNMDLKSVEKAMGPRVRAIIPVSLFGQVGDMDEINALAQEQGWTVIEDGAQSFGATYKGGKSGALSRFGVTSFFPAKPLGCYGDGGAVFCQTEEDFVQLKELRVHGQKSRYEHTRIGFNCRLDTIQCAIIQVKLKRYPWEIEQRRKVAQVYDEAFSDISFIKTPRVKEDRQSIYAQYTLQVKHRDDFQKKLRQEGVPTSVHYPRGMHQQPAFAHAPSPLLPVTESVCQKVLSLPLYADMPSSHVDHVVDRVIKVARCF